MGTYKGHDRAHWLREAERADSKVAGAPEGSERRAQFEATAERMRDYARMAGT